MLYSVAYAALAALSLVTPVEAGLFVVAAGTIAVARIDPIVNPGEIGGHVHSLFGASNIRDVLNTPEEQLRAQCTTAKVQDDKSSYWVPTLYYIRKDGTYEGMAHHSRIYYNVDPAYTPFPPGMRIVSGNSMNRNPKQESVRGVKMDFAALGRQEWGIYLPNTTTYSNFPGGPRTGIEFPSCGWANQSLDSDDHFSHLTWPIATGGGEIWQTSQSPKCPESHPIRYPNIFVETNYYPSEAQVAEWGSRSNHYIFSNGDLLGTSFHADFVNGWKPDVLASAIKNCGNAGENVGSCPALAAGGTDDLTRNNCRLQGMIPAEQNGFQEPLQYLPGCNPEWPADAGDEKPTDCPWRKPDPGFTQPNGFYSEGIIEQTMPLAVEMDPRAEVDWSLFTKVPGKNGKISAWGESQSVGRFFKFVNGAMVQKGSAQDVADNLNMATAQNKHSDVMGMQDTSAFTGLQPASVVGQNEWDVLQVPSGVPTILANRGGLMTNAVSPGGTITPSAGNASLPVATPTAGSPSAGNDTTPAAPTDLAASGSPGAQNAAGSPLPSGDASGSTPASGSASASPSAPASSPVQIPGGGNNLVAHNDGEIAPSGSAVGASTPAVFTTHGASASAAASPAPTGSKASGGSKKCSGRRRRRGSRLH
ncbi:hypothetical protein CcaverHIS002_0407730 [Cutaneotrichosporon cavernicola]|uniref:DUF1996 domain-containing protein n=1 Tax=Cutaneotrichosporon cavernicola TaxID=279322 RepID=A0AA48QW39_9TREE|nr:uncharacterized protein CcaverHIS019_0407710 [Cutaneotrichosporon cavernicola]BEI84169.1 hypothetical protein CcaverHIS002_0407730 [Cutaneotrichosporon cavernicola]BEI91951.1 hypothetical protein CcaverHIS019_0407710 [Cutaneotrichosporon cavernicola]BEI99722.1 hypothetical protein CcaverHIS631_0407650 [Cutaneotrichosporon cavernicola]BEJ07498.1 hypothetical protein CcaverHIS641_0407670 [Cutaneotrichosporon cavernicola]